MEKSRLFIPVLVGLATTTSYAAGIPVTDDGTRPSGQGFGYLLVSPDGQGVSVDASSAPHAVRGRWWSENAWWIVMDHGSAASEPKLVATSDPDALAFSWFAWSENGGWVSLAPRGAADLSNPSGSDPFFRISTGKFYWSAWSASLGWIDFSHLSMQWATPATPTSLPGKTFAADDAKRIDPAEFVPSFWAGYKAYVENWDSTALSMYGGSPFEHDFRKAKPYRMEITSPDGKAWTTTLNVVAAEPSTVLADAIVGAWSEPTSVDDDFIDTKTADWADFHSLSVRLRDKYGNPVISVPGVKRVSLSVAIANDVDLDQVDPASASPMGAGNYDLGDAIAYDGMWLVSGSVSNEATETNASDGNYGLKVFSYAPTKAAYPETTDRNDVKVSSIAYEVAVENGYSWIGETPRTPIAPPQSKMRFAPFAQVSSVTNPDNWEMRIWYPTDFSAALTRRSSARYSDMRVAASIDVEGANQLVSYQDPVASVNSRCFGYLQTIKALESSSYEVGGSAPTECDRSALWTSTDVRSATALPSNEHFGWTPKIVVAAPRTNSVRLSTEIAYSLSGRPVAHPSWNRSFVSWDGGNVAVGTSNQAAKIIGSMNSRGTAFDVLQWNTSNAVGVLMKTQVRDAVHRNVAAITRSLTSPTASDVLVIETDTVLTQWPAWKRTIVARDADVTLAADVRKPAWWRPLALIAISDGDKSKGNVRILNSVRNLDLSLYADGSVYSVNAAWGYVSDTPSSWLDQLFIRGSMISNNTMGGSVSTPLKCPVLFTGSCDAAAAKRFDINFFRFYRADPDWTGPLAGKGVPASDVPYEGLEFPLVIQYDPDVQSDPPPGFKSDR